MKLTVEINQFAPKHHNLDDNLEYIVTKSEESSSKIIIFPELATCGYFYQSKDVLNEFDMEANNEQFEKLQELATEEEKIICVGFAEKEEDVFYNSAAIFFPDEEISSIYRKSHLFYKESMVFEPGNTGFFTIEYEEWDIKIGLMICYDWRFPEAARTLALQGADLIICPANLVTGVWQGVMESRALENKVYLAVANRIGSETLYNETLDFNGESTILAYNGKALVTAGESNEISIIAEIESLKTRDKSFNGINDIFKDRREDLYFQEFD